MSLKGEGIAVEGEYPAQLCGGPYLVGEGMAYQTRAGDWRITVASEERLAGNVALNEEDGSVRVVVTANGPGKQLVRGPSNGGSLVVSDNFRRAEAKLELRAVVGRETANLVAIFNCE